MSSESSSSITASEALNRLQQGASRVQLVYVAHERWPFPINTPGATVLPELRISVLDSSFNPPTKAHLALALSSPPDGDADYHARLLLLSVRNADKKIKPNDATYLQRVEMMLLLASDMNARYSSAHLNVAVALIDEPTFVGKSTALLSFLNGRMASLDQSSTHPNTQLTFLLGFDTLERLFSPRFYASEDSMRECLHRFFSSDGDNSRVVCARRAIPGANEEEEDEKASELMQLVNELSEPGKVTMIDLDDAEKTISSAEVRKRLGTGDDSWRKLIVDNVAPFIVKHQLYLEM